MSELNEPEGTLPERAEFVEFGDFDPLEARRLLKHFENQGVRFSVEGRDQIEPVGGGSLRHDSQVRIFVDPADQDKAEAILREDWKL